MYKSLLTLNKEHIFQDVSLVVVNMNNYTKKMVNMKIFHVNNTNIKVIQHNHKTNTSSLTYFKTK